MRDISGERAGTWDKQYWVVMPTGPTLSVHISTPFHAHTSDTSSPLTHMFDPSISHILHPYKPSYTSGPGRITHVPVTLFCPKPSDFSLCIEMTVSGRLPEILFPCRSRYIRLQPSMVGSAITGRGCPVNCGERWGGRRVRCLAQARIWRRSTVCMEIGAVYAEIGWYNIPAGSEELEAPSAACREYLDIWVVVRVKGRFIRHLHGYLHHPPPARVASFATCVHGS